MTRNSYEARIACFLATRHWDLDLSKCEFSGYVYDPEVTKHASKTTVQAVLYEGANDEIWDDVFFESNIAVQICVRPIGENKARDVARRTIAMDAAEAYMSSLGYPPDFPFAKETTVEEDGELRISIQPAI